jgi:hypothetical protein
MALDLLIEAPINSLADNTKPARLLSRHFDITRQAELTKHAWSFAIFRGELEGLESEAIPAGTTYSYAYNMPENALRILPITDTGEAHGVSIPWKLEGTTLLVDQSGPLLVRYIGNLTDPADWNPLFTEALAARLAMKVALPLTNKPTSFQAAQNAYNEAIADARRINAIEVGSVAAARSWAAERGDPDAMRSYS